MSRSLTLVFLLTIPSSLGLIVLGRPIIGAIFQSGRFGAYDTAQTAVALSCYAIGLLGYPGIKILNPAFYALSDARTPMYVSLLSISINFCTALILLKRFHMGYAALALSTSLVAIVTSVCLFETLRRKLGGIGRYLVDRLARITAAPLLMALAIAVTNYVIRRHLSATRGSYWSDLAICFPLGLLVFVIASRAFGIHAIGIASDVFFAPLGRSFLALHAKIRN